ncbi:MAG TPA: thioredoxin family protein [Tepidisphaeraceae bacterium]
MRSLFAWMALVVFSATALAQVGGKGKVSAELNVSALQPGQQAVVAVVLKLGPGLHAQSHTPLESYLIPYTVKLDTSAQLQALDPIYPAPMLKTYPMLGNLSVYEGEIVTYVPVQVKSDAQLGELKISGTVTYQVCNDRMCFAPQNSPWQVITKIVTAGQKIAPGNAELFKNFNPAVFAAMKQTSQPATMPAQPAVEQGGFNVLGLHIGEHSYFLAFIAALFIGVIFNIMPCVLPIVPLKAMGFYQVAQFNRAKSLLLGAIFSLGIVAAFGVLAVLVVGLRWLDWGKLFSYPAFSLTIVVVLLALALQTFGVFEVVLPQGVYRLTPTHETLLGNFLFGIFTAVLSTPCTFGMFLGLLIWASAQPSVIGVAVLMMTGVGMALPYLILSAFPAMAQRLPRAGPWADLVKQMMGFLLVATAVYFLRPALPTAWQGVNIFWVIFVVIAASGIFLIGRTLAITHRPVPIAIAILIALGIVTPALAITRKLTYVPIQWQPSSPQTLQQAEARNQIVLIDFTAVWCGNCQALEATVFTDKQVVHSLHDHNVLTLRADLSASDAPGWTLLRQLNPVGAIPLTVIYEDGKPRQLAGLYSRSDLLEIVGQ